MAMRWTWMMWAALCAAVLGVGCVGDDVPPLSGTPDGGGNVETDAAGAGPCKLGSAVLGKCVLQK